MAETGTTDWVSFNGSSTLSQALTSTDNHKFYFPTDFNGIVLKKRIIGNGGINVTSLMALNGTLSGVSLETLAKSQLFVTSEGCSSARFYGFSGEDTSVAFNPGYGYIIAEGLLISNGILQRRLYIAKIEPMSDANNLKCTNFETKVTNL